MPTSYERTHSRSQVRRLSIVLGLNLTMIAGLLVVGLASHSLGVLAAGGDYAADSVAILLGIMAIQIKTRAHGHHVATTYVAGVNAIALLAVTGFVIYTGINRLVTHTPEIHGFSVLVVSIAATCFMATGAFILGKAASREDLHMRSVLLDTVSDGVASAAVAISGGIIYFTGKFYWLDSALAVIIGLIIGFNALKLLRDVLRAVRHKTAVSSDS